MEYKDKLNKIIDETFNKKEQKDCFSDKQQYPIDIRKKILLVDDNQILRDMYAMKFEKNDYEVKTASDGEETIKLIMSGFIPDIFITDLMIPNMDGLCLFEIIKNRKLAPNAIAIMLTNKGLLSEINKAKDLGFHGFIVKATTMPAEVVEQVKKIYKENCK